jgi:hypothetical protein
VTNIGPKIILFPSTLHPLPPPKKIRLIPSVLFCLCSFSVAYLCFTRPKKLLRLILENTLPPGGCKYQPMSFGGKNMKREREKEGKCKRKRKKEERKRNKGERK